MTHFDAALTRTSEPESLEFELPTQPGALVKALDNPAFGYLATLRTGPGRRTTTNVLVRVAAFFGGDLKTFDWASLRYPHMAALRTYLADTFSSATANRWITSVRGVLRVAWRMGRISLDDLERACDVKKVRGFRLLRGRSVPPEELERLFEATRRDKYRRRGARDAALVALLYGGGLRRSEAVSLDVGDFVTEESPYVRVIGKGDKERKVFLPLGAARIVARWVEVRGQRPGPLFVGTSPDGKLVWERLHDDSCRRIVKKLARRGDVPHLSPHDFRRTYIGDLLDAGADIVTVQHLAGHADPSTTAKYDRRGDRARAKAAQLLKLPGG